MPRLEELANVALRVPSILVLDLLYKCDIEGLTEHLKAKNEDMLFKYKYVIWNMYYLGHLINVVVLVLPLRHIVTLYLHILAALLLYMGHQISKDYIREELQYGYEGAVYLDSLAFNRFVSAMTSQIILSTLCAFLMKTRKVWLFSAHMLPLLARLCAAPHTTLLAVNTFAMGLTGSGIAIFLLSNLFVPYRLARAAYSELLQVIELYRLLAVGISLWNQFAVPLLFSVFWFVLFIVQLCSDVMSGNAASAAHQGIMFFLLTSVSECCATPYSLLGLTFVVSYLALGLLNLCKFYLGGYAAVQNENVMHRGVTEGVTLLLLALQTGLLDMQALQRTFLLSIILFIVVTSTLQSMIEITDPIILALGASRNRSLWKHFRGLSMCLLLLVFPVFMAYKISQFFHMDFWLLILVSSCMLTSLQVTGTMLIYSLFMVELFRSDPIESLDEVIYWVNAVSRVLEFVVALCVVAYGTWESLFGEWSWMGASVIIIHSYFNVWLRGQSGWRSFLLRQEAAKKINSLPRATAQQLQQHNDVCSICFQEMSSAVITYCRHFFHGNCLRKWLYVQETCPMCHQTVRPTPTDQTEASGDAPAERDEGPDLTAQEGNQNPDDGASQETQSNDVSPDSTEQEEEREVASAAESAFCATKVFCLPVLNYSCEHFSCFFFTVVSILIKS
uniref:RING finger protein 145 n=1 Tax=Lates calcarifer TaxID=8187 RepID=A0A4W6DJV4_LATCA